MFGICIYIYIYVYEFTYILFNGAVKDLNYTKHFMRFKMIGKGSGRKR
jgi:hypothetical protein